MVAAMLSLKEAGKHEDKVSKGAFQKGVFE